MKIIQHFSGYYCIIIFLDITVLLYFWILLYYHISGYYCIIMHGKYPTIYVSISPSTSERTTPRTEIKTSLFDFDDNDDDDDDDFFQNLSLSKHASAPLSNLETTIEENEKVKNVYDDAEESKTEEKTEFTDGEHFKDEENRTDIKRFVEDDKDDFIVSFDCLQKN